MSKLQEYIKQAEQSIDLAHHILTRTHPLSGDSKILLSVLTTIHTAHEKILLAVLDNEFLRPKPSLNASFIIRFDRFKQLVTEKKLLDKKELEVISRVEQEYQFHKGSSVEFTRNKNVIMADEKFNLNTINEKQLTEYISQTRTIIKKLFNVK